MELRRRYVRSECRLREECLEAREYPLADRTLLSVPELLSLWLLPVCVDLILARLGLELGRRLSA